MKTSETKISNTANRYHDSDSAPFFDHGVKGQVGGENIRASLNQISDSSSSWSSTSVQARHTIGPPDDQFEKEANATADKVVQRLSEQNANTVAKLGASSGDGHVSAIPGLQISRLPSTVSSKTAQTSNEASEEEVQEAGEEEIQRKPIFESAVPPAEDEPGGPVQRQSDSASSTTPASSDFSSQLNSSKGGGSPLPADTRTEMEDAFGADFSNVRVHTGGESERMSESINAQAFTHGSDIYFNSGKFNTDSNEGKHLLAHELTHTVQQGESVRRAGASSEKLGLNEITKKFPHDRGRIEKTNDNKFKIILRDPIFVAAITQAMFDGLMQRLTISSTSLPSENRKSAQGKLWRDEVKEDVKKGIKKLARSAPGVGRQRVANDEYKDKKNIYSLEIKRSKGPKWKGKFVGTIKEIEEAVMVPSWDKEGKKAVNFQIEHIIDYQLAGPSADDPKT